MASSPPSRAKKLRTFHISCWVLGLIAFVEIMGLGLALASKRHPSPAEPEIVERIVHVPTLIERPPSDPITPPRNPSVEESTSPPKPLDIEISKISPPPVAQVITKRSDDKTLVDLYNEGDAKMPPIDNPKVEALIQKARGLFVRGDTINAILNYQEALVQSPNEIQAIYGLGEIHEKLGNVDKATSFYQKVYERGTDAGVLFTRAARKIAEGIQKTDDNMLGKMSLGQIRQTVIGDKATLNIPILSAPNTQIDNTEVLIRVRIFVKDPKGLIREFNQSDRSTLNKKWRTGTVDWATQEETLQATFTRADLIDEPHFYGYIITLTYGSTIVDFVAKPRRLSGKIQRPSNQPQLIPNFDDPDFLDNINLENPILPVKPE